MEQDKKQVTEKSSGTKLWIVTTLVLSIAVVLCVAVFAYLAVNVTPMCLKTLRQSTPDVEDEIYVHTPGQDGEMREKLNYRSDDNVVEMEAEDGTWQLHDYNTGIHIVQLPGTELCYVTPTNSSAEEGAKVGDDLKSGERSFEGIEFEIKPISNQKISDSSFMSSEALSRCGDGFQWATITVDDSHHDVSGVVGPGGEMRRVKRDHCDCVVIIIIRCKCRDEAGSPGSSGQDGSPGQAGSPGAPGRR